MSLSKIFGIYSTSQTAEDAVDGLLSSGFKASAISVLHPDNQSTREFSQRRGTRPPAGTMEGKTASDPGWHAGISGPWHRSSCGCALVGSCRNGGTSRLV